MADAMSDDLYEEPGNDSEEYDEGEDADVEVEGDDLGDEVDAQARSYVGDDDDEEDEAEASDDDEEEEEERQPKKQKGSRYEKRLQQVIAQRKQEAARAAELQQRLQYYERQQNQLQASYAERLRQQQELKENFIGVQKELELLKMHREQQEESNLDPAERLKRQAVREAMELARQEQEKELAAIRKEHEDFRQQISREKAAVARRGRINGYDQQSSYATAQLLEELPTETAESLFDVLKTHVLNWGAAHSYRDLRQAATDFDRFAMKYALAKMKLRGRASGEARKKGKMVPQSSPTSKRNVKGRRLPTMEQARKKGYEDVLDAMRAQKGE